jgi:hypothetical protein
MIGSATGDDSRLLGNGYWPRFAPDNSRVLYAAKNVDAGEEWISVRTDGTDERSLGLIHDAHYTADGASIVYSTASYQRELTIMSADGSDRRRLGGPRAYITYLRPCAEGFICTIIQEDRVGDIYVISVPGEKVRLVGSIK